MSQRIAITQVVLPDRPFSQFTEQLRRSHANGGAELAAFDIGFASRNRLSEDGVIDSILHQHVVREALPMLQISESSTATALDFTDAFVLDARFAHRLHFGGSYGKAFGDGRSAKLDSIGLDGGGF